MEIDNEIPNKETRKRISYGENLHENIINLLDLNQDCWLLICNLLSYQDILNLSKVSSAYKEFVKNYLLPLKFTKWEISFAKIHDCISLEDFRYFLKSIRLTVKELRLLFLPDAYFEVLKSYQFPCVTEMRVTVGNSMNSADIGTLSYVFPNLRNFSPHGFCTSAAIEVFPNLENLTLTCCRNFSINDFRRILLTLNLKSLTLDIFKKIVPLNPQENLKLSKIEHITLNCHELGWLCCCDTNNPVPFKNLKALIITGHILDTKEIDKFFGNIQTIVPRNPYEIEMVNINVEFLCKFLVPEKNTFLNNVKVLKFINVRIILDVFGTPCRYQDLSELYFFYCHATVSDEVLTILSNAKHLDLLSFEECNTPHIILSEVFLNEALKGRKKAITFNWYSQKSNLEVCWKSRTFLVILIR